MKRPTFPPMRYERWTLTCLLFGHHFQWKRIDWMWVQEWCACGTTGETRMERARDVDGPPSDTRGEGTVQP